MCFPPFILYLYRPIFALLKTHICTRYLARRVIMLCVVWWHGVQGASRVPCFPNQVCLTDSERFTLLVEFRAALERATGPDLNHDLTPRLTTTPLLKEPADPQEEPTPPSFTHGPPRARSIKSIILIVLRLFSSWMTNVTRPSQTTAG